MNPEPADILQDAVIRRSTARDLVFKGADLCGCNLLELRADGLDFAEADLSKSSLAEVKWRSCVLRDARLDAVDFTDAVLRMCDFDRARVPGAKLVRTRLENSTARGACFDGADFSSAILTDTDFSRASFRGANLEGISASGADFRGADMTGANLQNAELTDADLRGADLTGADLHGADLSGADLRGVVGDDPLLRTEESEWGELPSGMQPLAETMIPIVGEMLRTAGRRGTIDDETAEKLIAEGARNQTSPRNAPSPETLEAVSNVLDELGDKILPTLLAALQQPNDSDPPPEVKEMILRLREAFSLDESATTEDVLAQLTKSIGFPSG